MIYSKVFEPPLIRQGVETLSIDSALKRMNFVVHLIGTLEDANRDATMIANKKVVDMMIYLDAEGYISLTETSKERWQVQTCIKFHPPGPDNFHLV